MSISKGSVRIIGGEHKSRRLRFTDQGGDVRPTPDNIRETLFNWLQFDLPGSRVLDLYAGSGALAAEALSRGAAHAELVEKKARRAADLRNALKPLFAERVSIHSIDALRWLTLPGHHPFDLVFVDPPYELGVTTDSCYLLESQHKLAPQAWIYVESRSHHEAPAVPDNWRLHREKCAGEVAARLYQRE